MKVQTTVHQYCHSFARVRNVKARESLPLSLVQLLRDDAIEPDRSYLRQNLGTWTCRRILLGVTSSVILQGTTSVYPWNHDSPPIAAVVEAWRKAGVEGDGGF